MAKTLQVKEKSESSRAKTESRQVERTAERPQFIPPTDIHETAEGLVLWMDLPGVAEDAVDVHLENGVLTVTGRVNAPDPGHRSLVLHEYRVGDYQRSFTVTEDIDPDHIEAELHNGVLRIFLPKAEQLRPRKIQVRAV